MENGMGKNPVRLDSTRLTGKIAQNKPGQKQFSKKRGVRLQHLTMREQGSKKKHSRLTEDQ